MCIGTNIGVPHYVIDKGFENDEKMKNMQWYDKALQQLEHLKTVDQDFSVKVALGTSIQELLKSESSLLQELCKGFSVEA